MPPSAARFAAIALSVTLFVSVLAPFLAGPAAANITGEPDISLTIADNRVDAGETTTLEVSVVNRGELDSGSDVGNAQAEQRVTTARGLTLTPRDSGPITVHTNTQAVGNVPDGEAIPARFEITVDEDADPGTYRIPIDVGYKYSPFVSERASHSQRNEVRSRTKNVRVVVDEEDNFEITGVESTAESGSDGWVAVTFEHTGDRTVDDTTVEFQSRSSGLRFGGSDRTTAYLGTVEPGDRRTVRVEGAFSEDARSRDYAADLALNYDERGGDRTGERHVVGVEPEADQTFAFENVDSTLRVAQDGTVRGTVVNEGPNEARNVVVTLSPPGQNVRVLEPEVAVGDLDAGERVDVAFDVEISSAARAGPRQFTISTEYENLDGDTQRADDVRFRQTVEPRRDVFTVEPVNATVTAGGSDRIVLAVTNNEDETVTDVSAKVFASSPLSVSDDEAFVDELEPGETAELAFRVSAAGSAMQKDYPISVDFQYVDEDGETRLTDSYRVPVGVEEKSGGLFGSIGPVIPAGLVALGLAPLASIAFRYRRR
ncbi:COG1361 S-layer family protein [Natronomonas sp.]|uniref:COG1361 S-layer family protein n=2 Tax=Natronomonas sp. TaxID=2184060 RepID=UPI002FC325CA